MLYGFIYLADRSLEFFTGQPEVAGKPLLKRFHVLLKTADIDLLISDNLKLLLIMQGVQRRISQKGNHRYEKLWTDDIHFRVLIGYVNNPVVVKLVIYFKQRDKNCIFAVFFVSVFVQLLQKVLVLMLGRCFVRLVFHLKHDGNIFRAVFTIFTIDEIPLTARPGIIVLFKISIRKCRHPNRVKLRKAMLFQAFSNHLG